MSGLYPSISCGKASSNLNKRTYFRGQIELIDNISRMIVTDRSRQTIRVHYVGDMSPLIQGAVGFGPTPRTLDYPFAHPQARGGGALDRPFARHQAPSAGALHWVIAGSIAIVHCPLQNLSLLRC